MQVKKIIVALGIGLASLGALAVDLKKETEDYRRFVIGQMDLLVADTEKFATALKSGKVAEAKKIYPLARMYFERSEPIAESFGDLDPRIDARLADLTEEARELAQNKGKSEAEIEASVMDQWSGFHKIEKILWEQNTTKGTEAVAEQLVRDVKELRAKIPTAEVTPELMITGAVDLLNEVSTTKITGEEDIFSKTDLFDFKANIEGAEEIFRIFRPHLEAKDSKLAIRIERHFNAVNDLLQKHNRAPQGYDYVGYDKLTPQDIKALAEAVNKLGEPLAQMGVILE